MKNLGEAHANLDQQAYGIIKEMIRSRKLLPGEKISQNDLAHELGISRTPLVSALKYMEKENLVESRPRRGFFVRQFSHREMLSIFELREVLEGLAARRAASKITDGQIIELRRFFSSFAQHRSIDDYRTYCDEDRRFHNFVTDLGDQEFLKSILKTYNIISFSYQLISSEGLVRSPDDTIDEHLDIITAICNRDAEAAERLMRRHFRRSIAALKKRPDAFGNDQPEKNAA